MAYNKINWVNDDTELSAENFNYMESGIADSYNISLLAVSDTAPSECSTGDKYYNTSTKKIYTATATNTWSTTGEDPISDILYIVLEERTSYTYDGTDLVSVGGGSGSGIAVYPDEPTEDTKLVFEETDLDFQGIDYDVLFPIGKVEIFFDSLDHSNYLGLSWEQVGAGRVPVGLDTSDNDFNTIGKTGGEKTHTLAIEELPQATPTFRSGNDGNFNMTYVGTGGNFTADAIVQVSQNNLQPYIVMAFWKRVS